MAVSSLSRSLPWGGRGPNQCSGTPCWTHSEFTGMGGASSVPHSWLLPKPVHIVFRCFTGLVLPGPSLEARIPSSVRRTW